jgi:hypothetical protein
MRDGGCIRSAREGDANELARLYADAGMDTRLSGRACGERTHVLVLDVDGALRATASVVIDDQRHARVERMVLDRVLGRATEMIAARMIGVARALCDAFGCHDVMIGPQTALRRA